MHTGCKMKHVLTVLLFVSLTACDEDPKINLPSAPYDLIASSEALS